MRYLILAVILFVGITSYCQDKKVTALPADATLNTNDLFYVIDQSVTSKKMTAATILDVVSDTANNVRGELADTAAQLRSEISGGGAFSATGDVISLTSTDDTLELGGSSGGNYRFWVNGRAGVNLSLSADTLRVFGTVAQYHPWITGDVTGNLILGDLLNQSGVTLSSIISGSGIFSTGSSGGTDYYYPTNTTYNWNFGGTGVTSYKLNVTGSLGVTASTYLGSGHVMYFGSVSGFNNSFYVNPSANYFTFKFPNLYSVTMEEKSYTTASQYYSQVNAGIIHINPSNYTPNTPAEGDIRWLNSGNAPQYYSGTAWTNFGGLSSHITDTLFLDYLGDSTTADVWLTLTNTNAIDTAHTVNAGFMLTLSPFETVDVFMKDVELVNGSNELKWMYWDVKTKSVKVNRGLAGLKPVQQINAIMAMVERSLKYNLENHEKLQTLESELRKTQYELDELRRNYGARLRDLEDKLNEK